MTTPVPDLARELRTAQTIAVALMLGVAVFAGIAAYVAPMGGGLEPIVAGMDPIALTAAFVTVTSALMSFVVPARLVGSITTEDPARRVAAWRGGRIVALALLEGPALLWGVALLLSANRWYLLPIVMLLALMAVHFPTQDSLRSAVGARGNLD